MESEKEIYFNCEKQQIKNAMEDINELVKDIKKNNMYLSNKENLSLQTLNLYINDSTPNCYIREEIVKLKDMLNNVGGEVFITSVNFAIKEIEELLNKE